MEDLLLKKCVPCEKKDLSPMREETANRFRLQVYGKQHRLYNFDKVPKWELVSGDFGVMKLRRKWKVKTFLQGLEFFKVVANLAQAEDHHPDLHLVESLNVTIELCTHACGGVTENDFILAAKIDKLPLQQFLRHM